MANCDLHEHVRLELRPTAVASDARATAPRTCHGHGHGLVPLLFTQVLLTITSTLLLAIAHHVPLATSHLAHLGLVARLHAR